MSEAPNRRGLGRGLSALLGDAPPPLAGAGSAEAPSPSAPAGPPREAPIELLRRNPDQPRRAFTEGELEELTASVRERGVLQPILVRPAPGAPGEYQIVAGERRWRAAQRAGLHVVPIVVREDLDDLDVLEIGIVENVQRENLTPIEEAMGYRVLADRFGRTQEDIARTVGKSRSHVANALRLLTLPPPVLALVDAGALSAGHARALVGAPEPERLARAIVDRGLSVRQAEELGRVRAPRAPRPAAGEAKSPDTLALEADLSEALGLRVTVLDRSGAGEVKIAYGSLEQLDEICRRLSG